MQQSDGLYFKNFLYYCYVVVNMKNLTRKILYVLIFLTVIGESISIFLWTNSPVQRSVLIVDWEIAVLNAVIMVPLNLLALFWIIKRKDWGPLFLIAISIGNRIASQIFFDSGMHGLFITWTALLVFFAYFTYRPLNKIEILSILGGYVTGFIAFILTYNYTYNSIISTTALFLVLISWIGTIKAIMKYR